jgi:hypothetical protein
MYIFTLIGQWDYWLKSAEEYAKLQSDPMCYSNCYVIDNLLYHEMELKQKELVENVTNSSIFDEEKAIILLYLYIVENKKADEIYKQKVKDFKNKYPESKYKAFIDNYLPKPTNKSSMGYCFGSTVVFPTNNFSDKFSSNGTFLMTMDFNIGKVFTSLYFNGGSLKLKEPITASSGTIIHNFSDGETFSYFEGGFLGGYFLVRNNYFQLAPYFTFAGTSLESDMYESSSNEPEVNLISSFTYGPGLHTELKFYQTEPKENAPYPYYYYMKNYFSFKADAGYNIIASPESDIFKGNIFYFRLGIVWGIGEF